MNEITVIPNDDIRNAIGFALERYDGSGDDWMDYGDHAMLNVYVEDGQMWIVAYPNFDSGEILDGQVLLKVNG